MNLSVTNKSERGFIQDQPEAVISITVDPPISTTMREVPNLKATRKLVEAEDEAGPQVMLSSFAEGETFGVDTIPDLVQREEQTQRMSTKTPQLTKTIHWTDNDPVGCRLQEFAAQWTLARPWTRTVIKRGFHWTWKSLPPLSFPKHHLVSSKVQELVLKLYSQGALYKVTDQPCFLSRTFLVPKGLDGQRLIIDLSALNKFISFPSFHMTNHNTLRNCLDFPCWMATVDIQDAYLHVPVRKSLHKYLALSCNHQLFFFRCLPFGLAPTPLVFTVLMKFPINNLRARGFNVLNYLDDLIIWDKNQVATNQAVKEVVHSLETLGFLINTKKSKLAATQRTSWLGVDWDSEQGTCCLPEASILKISRLSNMLFENKCASRRLWESLMGCIAFAAQLSDRAKLMSHPVMKPQRFPSKNRGVVSQIPQSLVTALLPWLSPTFLRIPSPVRVPPPAVTVWCDASLSGWGAFSSTDKIWSGRWDLNWRQSHINILELRAVLLVLQDWEIQETCILIATDNSTTVSAINKRGSPSTQVHEIATQLFNHVLLHRNFLTAVHIQGHLNVVADSLSRDLPVATEWSLSQKEFCRLEDLHGSLLQIDLFATPLNNKIKTFATTLDHPRATVVNAFTINWNSWNQIYLFPPINLLPRVVKTLRAYRGGGTNNLPSSSRSRVVSISQKQGALPSHSGITLTTSPGGENRSLLDNLRALDRMQFLDLLYRKEFSAEVSNKLLKGFRDSSIRQAEVGWRVFKEWLPRSLDTVGKSDVLQFLVFLENKGLSPNTIMAYRNSLRIPLERGFGISFKDNDFSILARAQFLENPPEGKIVPQWSLEDALDVIMSKRDLRSLSFKEQFMITLIFSCYCHRQ